MRPQCHGAVCPGCAHHIPTPRLGGRHAHLVVLVNAQADKVPYRAMTEKPCAFGLSSSRRSEERNFLFACRYVGNERQRCLWIKINSTKHSGCIGDLGCVAARAIPQGLDREASLHFHSEAFWSLNFWSSHGLTESW